MPWSARTLAPLAIVACALVVATLVALGHAPRVQQPLPRPTIQRFDATRAYAVTRLQLSFGPRPAGSFLERHAAERLVSMLPGGHFEAVPGGLRNIVGELPGRAPAILVAAHYDTTPIPGYLGANNGAAGTAAVIEIARALRRGPNLRAVRFLLTDGEEAPAGSHRFLTEGDRGSRAYLAAHAGTVGEVVLLDFIALAHERMPREAGSDPRLWSRLRAAATRVGVASIFPASTRPAVLDDHTPFAHVGIPAIDLIDFDYPCWEKACDNLAQVSPRALAATGAAALELVDSERRR